MDLRGTRYTGLDGNQGDDVVGCGMISTTGRRYSLTFDILACGDNRRSIPVPGSYSIDELQITMSVVGLIPPFVRTVVPQRNTRKGPLWSVGGGSTLVVRLGKVVVNHSGRELDEYLPQYVIYISYMRKPTPKKMSFITDTLRRYSNVYSHPVKKE